MIRQALKFVRAHAKLPDKVESVAKSLISDLSQNTSENPRQDRSVKKKQKKIKRKVVIGALVVFVLYSAIWNPKLLEIFLFQATESILENIELF